MQITPIGGAIDEIRWERKKNESKKTRYRDIPLTTAFFYYIDSIDSIDRSIPNRFPSLNSSLFFFKLRYAERPQVYFCQGQFRRLRLAFFFCFIASIQSIQSIDRRDVHRKIGFISLKYTKKLGTQRGNKWIFALGVLLLFHWFSTLNPLKKEIDCRLMNEEACGGDRLLSEIYFISFFFLEKNSADGLSFTIDN